MRAPIDKTTSELATRSSAVAMYSLRCARVATLRIRVAPTIAIPSPSNRCRSNVLAVGLLYLHITDQDVSGLVEEIAVARDVRDEARHVRRGRTVRVHVLVRPERVFPGDDVRVGWGDAVDRQLRQALATDA